MRSGDIVKKIDGQSIDTADKLQAIWESVKLGKAEFKVEIERMGGIRTIIYKIIDDRDITKNQYTISKSEIQQKVLNDMDTALKGLRAGPHHVNNSIAGYKLYKVSIDNILYKYGFRSGDIIKKVNGQAVDSTEKLLGIWKFVKNGKLKLIVDIERKGKIETFILKMVS